MIYFRNQVYHLIHYTFTQEQLLTEKKTVFNSINTEGIHIHNVTKDSLKIKGTFKNRCCYYIWVCHVCVYNLIGKHKVKTR